MIPKLGGLLAAAAALQVLLLPARRCQAFLAPASTTATRTAATATLRHNHHCCGWGCHLHGGNLWHGAAPAGRRRQRWTAELAAAPLCTLLHSQYRRSHRMLLVAMMADGGTISSTCSEPALLNTSLPLPTRQEVLRLELKSVSAANTRRFLQRWGGTRVPDRPDVGTPGVPRTNMPVTTELKEGDVQGLRLVFDASPTDRIDIDVYPLAGGASAIIVTRTGEGMARAGGLGPQIASLVREAEDKIKLKLQLDCDAFARSHTLAKRAGALSDDADQQEPPPQQQAQSASAGGASAASAVDAVFSDTAFPGGTMYADPLESMPGGRESFEREAFAAFEKTRAAASGATDAAAAVLELEEQPQGSGGTGVKGVEGVLEDLRAHNSTESQLAAMFEAGRNAAVAALSEDQLAVSSVQDLVQLGVILGPATGLQGGLDIFTGPPKAVGGEFESVQSTPAAAAAAAAGERVYTMYDEDDVPVLQLTESELSRIDADALELEMARLDGMLYELGRAPADMRAAILREYSDVLLDEYYILAMRARVPRLETEEQRALLQQVNARAVALVGQLAGLKQAQEVQELEKIRTICETAMDDMARLPDKVRSMKPLLNGEFVAYLAYAIDKERKALRAKGMDPDREPSRWLQVLGVIRRGVFAELEKDVYLDVQAIHYVLRMHEPQQRRDLLEATITSLPSMDVRGFRKTAHNIIEHVAARTDGAVDDALRERVAEFGALMAELLPDARVELLSREADEWAAQRVADREAVRAAAARDRPDFSQFSVSDARELLSPADVADGDGGGSAGVVDLTALYAQQAAEGEDAFGEGAGDDWGLWEEGEIEAQSGTRGGGDAVPGMLDGERFGGAEPALPGFGPEGYPLPDSSDGGDEDEW